MEFIDMVGKTLESVEVGDERVVFNFSDGTAAESYHSPDCCESVSVQSVDGKIPDIIGSPILEADESCDSDNPPRSWNDSWTWTHQTIRTEKGEVVFHWLGESNGYYGETPYFRLTHGRLV